MLKIFFIFILLATLGEIQANAQETLSTSSCPNMNGLFTHKEVLGKARAEITQVQCDSMRFVIDAMAMGQSYFFDVTSPLDGVRRIAPSTSSNEEDWVSSKFDQDTLIVVVDQYKKNKSGQAQYSQTTIKANMTDANHIEISVSGQYKKFVFTRIYQLAHSL